MSTLETPQIQKLLDKARQAVGFPRDDFEHLSALFRVVGRACQECLGRELHVGHGRAKLMRHVREKVSAAGFPFVQRAGHGV